MVRGEGRGGTQFKHGWVGEEREEWSGAGGGGVRNQATERSVKSHPTMQEKIECNTGRKGERSSTSCLRTAFTDSERERGGE